MSMARTFDLQLESCTADPAAKAIASWGLGPIISSNRSPARAPGSEAQTKETADEILNDADVMLRAPRFGGWMGTTNVDDKNDSATRRKVRVDLRHFMLNNKNALTGVMSRMVTHMGANFRAYRFLCFQTELGCRKNESITLAEVKEVIPQRWIKPAPREKHAKYLQSGNVIQFLDSVHAYAWWTLSDDELAAVRNSEKRVDQRPASHMVNPPPIFQGLYDFRNTLAALRTSGVNQSALFSAR